MESQAVEQMQQTVATVQPQPTQQVQQIQQNKEFIDPLSKLEPKHQMAIKLRLQGYTYPVIATLMEKAAYNVTEYTLRYWFMTGGVCHEVYKDLQAKRAKEVEEDIKKTDKKLKEAAINAAALLEASLNDDTISERRLNTARDLLDRTGFPKTSKVEQNGRIESDGLTVVAQGIKSILEGKAQNGSK